ncbi:MAG: beta-ketoacyl synthase N-terminal-like domain-containing protein, partial [Gaiellaceae bacterium]
MTLGSFTPVAVVGLAGRFPAAADVETYWANLVEGRDCVARFADEELRAAGIDAQVLEDPRYVKAFGSLDDVEGFDAELFRMSAREAELVDPQQRLLLECAWEALEDAGYDPATTSDPIGVFAGSSMNTYLLN